MPHARMIKSSPICRHRVLVGRARESASHRRPDHDWLPLRRRSSAWSPARRGARRPPRTGQSGLARWASGLPWPRRAHAPMLSRTTARPGEDPGLRPQPCLRHPASGPASQRPGTRPSQDYRTWGAAPSHGHVSKMPRASVRGDFERDGPAAGASRQEGGSDRGVGPQPVELGVVVGGQPVADRHACCASTCPRARRRRTSRRSRTLTTRRGSASGCARPAAGSTRRRPTRPLPKALSDPP